MVYVKKWFSIEYKTGKEETDFISCTFIQVLTYLAGICHFVTSNNLSVASFITCSILSIHKSNDNEVKYSMNFSQDNISCTTYLIISLCDKQQSFKDFFPNLCHHLHLTQLLYATDQDESNRQLFHAKQLLTYKSSAREVEC